MGTHRVTGQWADTTGKPATGHIRFIQPCDLIDTGRIRKAGSITATLDEHGRIDIELTATTTPATCPNHPWAWTVLECINGQTHTRQLQLLADTNLTGGA